MVLSDILEYKQRNVRDVSMLNSLIIFLAKYGIYGIIVTAFFEAIFFPPPVEIILLPLMLSNTKKAILYGLITAVVSLIGSMAGYYLGTKLGRPLLVKFFGEEKVQTIKRIYDKYGAFAVVTSAFTPIPYEAYTLSAGAFKMNFIKYMVAVFVSRILRYLPEGIAVQLFGHAISTKSLTNIAWFVTSILLMAAIYLVLRKKNSTKHE